MLRIYRKKSLVFLYDFVQNAHHVNTVWVRLRAYLKSDAVMRANEAKLRQEVSKRISKGVAEQRLGKTCVEQHSSALSLHSGSIDF